MRAPDALQGELRDVRGSFVQYKLLLFYIALFVSSRLVSHLLSRREESSRARVFGAFVYE